MKNITPGPDTTFYRLWPVVSFRDIDREVVDALPVRLVEHGPGLICTARLEHGEVVEVFYGAWRRKLAFFAEAGVVKGDPAIVVSILCESRLPVENVTYRWDEDPDLARGAKGREIPER